MSDVHDIRKKLLDAGIPLDGWKQTEGGARPLPPSILRQKELLVKVRDILQMQLDQDKAKLAELHETENRLRYGGGS